nr:hypothetical protein [Tanacetum cinerariifolium]
MRFGRIARWVWGTITWGVGVFGRVLVRRGYTVTDVGDEGYTGKKSGKIGCGFVRVWDFHRKSGRVSKPPHFYYCFHIEEDNISDTKLSELDEPANYKEAMARPKVSK